MVELTRPSESIGTARPADRPGSRSGDGAGPPVGPDGSPDLSILAYLRYLLDRYERTVRTVVDVLVLMACSGFVLLQLGPTNLLSDTTPAGGDMGAHVWGPDFLRDELLPNFQLAGWAPDWYAGFAAYQFYMVLPMLAIVVLDVGVVELTTIPGVALAALAAAWVGVAVGLWPDRRWRAMAIGVPILAALLIALPYGVAFKLIAVSGPLTLPLAAYGFGRLAGLRFPGPGLFAVATLPYLFYQGYSIYGGNLPSMLAGEFAFSMSLSLALVYLGVVVRGLETGRYRVLAAVLLALTGLCHIIPAFWALLGTAIIVVMRPRLVQGSLIAGLKVVAVGGAVTLVGLADWLLVGWPLSSVPGPLPWSQLITAVGVGVFLTGAWRCSQSVQWLLPAMVVGGLLSAFWVVPFALRQDFVNDMGWEKLGEGEGSVWERWGEYLLPGIESDADPQTNLMWVFGLALVGTILSVALRSRVGAFLTAMTLATGLAFIFMPEGRLWNGRILPFYYLTAFLLAFLAVALVIQALVDLQRRWPAGFPAQEAGRLSSASRVFPLMVGAFSALGAVAAVLLVVGLPLGVVPFSESVRETAESDPTGYRWPALSPWQIESDTPGEVNVPSWADWNLSGYEGKDDPSDYHEDKGTEYFSMISTMETVGEEHGCGRALWEYDFDTLDRYGTPMAPMLLPYWTDGCIASMEGLYFEASMTTPYHFLMQTELSESPSSAQRAMPYSGFNFDLGVQHLQLMGVKYYMATTEVAVGAAREHPELTEIDTSEPWEVFEVAGSELVVPLAYEPAVLSGVGHSADDWLREPSAYQAAGAQQGALPGDDADPGLWPLAPDGWATEPPPPPGEDEADYDPSEVLFGPSVQWFLNPAVWDVPLAVSGPSEWQRIDLEEAPEWRSVRPAEVSAVDVDRERISFEVDEPGSPVLIKMSYFPNWEVSGGSGPWRVAPNLMVVLPTEEEVTLTYGTTPVEWLAYLLTIGGLVGVVALARRGRYRFGTGKGAVGENPYGDGDVDNMSGLPVDDLSDLPVDDVTGLPAEDLSYLPADDVSCSLDEDDRSADGAAGIRLEQVREDVSDQERDTFQQGPE